MRAEMQFMRATKALASLHICTCFLEPSSFDNAITAPKSRAGELCAIYASECSSKSAYLRTLA